MYRVKDIKQLIIPKGNLLVEIVEKKSSGIILPGSSVDKKSKFEHEFSYGVVIAKADNVTLFDVGDIILDFGPVDVFAWKGKKYCVVLDLTIRIGVKSDNFDVNKKEDIVS